MRADLSRDPSIRGILVRHGSLPVLAALVLSALPLSAQISAFPGAQGFGKFTSGGRGGSVYHVTTTNDSGTGSFRDAVSSSGRTVVFDIGGIIDYSGSRFAPADNITIAGQTAPGDGITIYGDGLSFSSANNNICRFLRVREGINGTSGTDAIGIANGHDMIFDHLSVSWGRDETFSINGNVTNITIQSTMVSQGLQGHSAGGLIQTDGGVSILRCLYMDNDTRNPKVKGVNEFVNNVVCNWETIGYNMGGDSAGDSYVNMFNNYFIRGQASSSTAIGGGNLNFHIYATNNWLDANRNGILDGSEMSFTSYGSMDLMATPYPYPITSAYSPLTALKLAISDVGTSFRRDAVDKMMISQLTSWGLDGGTITSELVPPMSGPGVIRNGAAYTDTDGDGMPDFWENGTGSSATTPNNNDASPSGSGYTRLEDYLNWLAEPHGIALQNTNVVVDLRQFTWGWVAVNHSPVWSVSNATNGAVSLVNSYFARFIPTAGLNGSASFAFTVTDSDGSTLTRTMNLFFTPLAHSYSPIWHGDDLTNNWNLLGDFNWHDGISLLYQFHNGDAVTFDDTGSTNPAVNLSGSLQPASVTVAATRSFVFSGNGSLDGAMTLNKTNTGTLTIYTTNHFTGNTVVGNGALLVHGALNQSPVTVRSGGTVGGNGALGNGLTLQAGATLAPGNGIGAPGTLTVTNTLTLAGGVTNRFDFSDDPTGLIKTNDTVQIVGNLAASGVNLIKVSLLDGLPGNGVYTLFTYTGAFTGGLSNFTVSGASGVLTNPPHAIAIVVNAVRPAATLVWKGGSAANLWDTGTTANWLNDGVADRFYFLDDVEFDSSGSTNPAVSLAGDLTPNSVTVDATVNYTFGGTGKITGTTGLTKTNSGTLAITTTNDFTGLVIIGGGVLSVTRLANGGAASGIGAAALDSANLLFYGSTLRYAGSTTATDRGATLKAAGATIEVTNSSTTLTWNGTNVGAGALIKSGPGTLTLTAENSFSGGTIVSNGMLALSGPAGGATITANNYALGSGGVTLYGGILRLFGGKAGDASAGYGTFSRPINVPAGATASLYAPARYTMSSALTGGGTLHFDVNYVRGTLSGNWSAFAGVINVTAYTSPAEFRVANTYGYAGATIYLNDNVILTRSGSAATIEIGALGGSSGAVVGVGNSTSSGSSYRVGWNNADVTFAGQLQADGANTFIKVGTGTWTLTGANSYTGGTVVNGGTLMVNNTSGSGTGSGAVTVNSGGTLAGSGIISGAVTVNAGGTNSPGSGGSGTLTVNNSVTLAAGSVTRIEINKTASTRDLLDASGTLTYGGTLVVTNLSGTLANGDGFKIFDAGSYAGAFSAMVLPPLASDLRWYTGPLTANGSISVVSTNFTIPQAITWAGDGISNFWNTSALNWLGTNALPRAFANGDTVTFNNSGSIAPVVNLTASVAPAAMTVNASQNYTITGTGALTGTMTLTKAGTGKLTLANIGTNTFTGGITVSAGSLQIGDGVSANGNLAGNIANSATLIYANPTDANSASVISGNGTLVKQAAGNLTITSTNASGFSGNVIISGGALSLGTGASLNTGTLTLTNGGTFNFPPSNPSYAYPGSVIVPASQTGTIYSPGLANTVSGNLSSGNSRSVLYISSGVSFGGTSTTQFDNFTGTVNVQSGATLRFSPNSSGNTYGSLNPSFVVNGTLQPRNAGNTVRLGQLFGTGTLAGPQSNASTGNTTYQIGGANVDSIFGGVISSNSAVAGSLVVLQKVGTGRLTLTGSSTYTGGTTVSNGTLLANNTTGSATGSGSVAVRSGATLGGSGIIAGATTIESGAKLTPGDGLGTLVISNTLTLQASSTNVMEISAALHTNDLITGVTTLSCGGRLFVTNLSGTLAAGDTFKLFSAASYNGSFTSTTLPALAANLYWTNRLSVNGTLAVASAVNTTPTTLTDLASGGLLILSWPQDHIGWRLEAQTNSLAVGLGTNWFTVSGSTTTNLMSFPMAPANSSVFYRLKYP